ncbi:MAG: hypothetical protein Q8M44_02865, partial [bacterium]|nr:hypothetical protein [bacterium]
YSKNYYENTKFELFHDESMNYSKLKYYHIYEMMKNYYQTYMFVLLVVLLCIYTKTENGI